MLPTGSKTRELYDSVWVGIHVDYRDRTKRWQKAPYDLSLPFYNYGGRLNMSPTPGSSYLGSPRYQAHNVFTAELDSAEMSRCLNKAYENFRGSVYESASLGVDFVEYRQSLDMIAKRCLTLAKSMWYVQHLQFANAARELRMGFVPPKVSKRRSAANNWLEYHFGWEPLINDIYDAADVMNSPIKTFDKAHGGSRYRSAKGYLTNFGSVFDHGFQTNSYQARQGGFVRAITNQTLHSLDQFGLANPLTLVWEVIPFSFVADWFVNLGSVIAAQSDFAGMELGGTYTSTLYRATYVGRVDAWNPRPTDPPPLMYSVSGYKFDRVSGLTKPVFSVNRLRLPSISRTATAVSLLIQQSKSMR